MMTLYLLFERLDSGKMKLDTEMPVSEHASDQDPTKLGLRPGQTIAAEDAIKGLITRSANDAAVVIAEAIGGSEDNFAKMMTRKAHALGMSRTVYRNASGLPSDEQVTTARDQSILGRALQDRFPRYYRFFSTTAFSFHGQTIRGHNHLLGSVEGVDGIKTGYTRASGFNLVTSMHRGNRFLIGVVLGGRSGGSRDATMRSLLADNLDKAATKRTVAAITEHNSSDANMDVADAAADERPQPSVQAPGQAASAAPQPPIAAGRAPRFAALAEATAAVPPPQATKVEPRSVDQWRDPDLSQWPWIPGSSEPMKPVKVKTVQVKMTQIKLASAAPSQPVTPITSAIPGAHPDVPETSSAVVAKAEVDPKVEFNPNMPPQTARSRHWKRDFGCASRLQFVVFSLAGDGQCRAGVAAAIGCARRRHQASRGPQWMDRPGRRARKRGRSPATHRGRSQPGPWPARQSRSVYRTGHCQGRPQAVPRPVRRP